MPAETGAAEAVPVAGVLYFARNTLKLVNVTDKTSICRGIAMLRFSLRKKIDAEPSRVLASRMRDLAAAYQALGQELPRVAQVNWNDYDRAVLAEVVKSTRQATVK